MESLQKREKETLVDAAPTDVQDRADDLSTHTGISAMYLAQSSDEWRAESPTTTANLKTEFRRLMVNTTQLCQE